MRIVVVAALVALFTSNSVRAETFQVTPGQYYVVGDFPVIGSFGFITGSLSYSIVGGGTPLPGLPYDPLFGPFYGYFISLQANDGQVQGCAFSQADSMCGRGLRNLPIFDVTDIDLDGRGILNIFGGASVTNETPIELAIFVSLPNGFTIESMSAVPEPSTWAMLLIGFAGIGFSAYRTSRRHGTSHTLIPSDRASRRLSHDSGMASRDWKP